jgi:ring-1,2-phenylacetyl-CoA epoxidase subunit PaaB
MMIRKFYYGDIPEDAGTGTGTTGTGAGLASVGTRTTSVGASAEPKTSKDWPLWEVFIRSKQGLDHKHMGSLHAADAEMAIENARDVYTRRMEGVSIWVVESKYIHASNPDDAESFYEPANDKVYRHPTFYQLPDELSHM